MRPSAVGRCLASGPDAQPRSDVTVGQPSAFEVLRADSKELSFHDAIAFGAVASPTRPTTTALAGLQVLRSAPMHPRCRFRSDRSSTRGERRKKITRSAAVLRRVLDRHTDLLREIAGRRDRAASPEAVRSAASSCRPRRLVGNQNRPPATSLFSVSERRTTFSDKWTAMVATQSIDDKLRSRSRGAAHGRDFTPTLFLVLVLVLGRQLQAPSAVLTAAGTTTRPGQFAKPTSHVAVS